MIAAIISAVLCIVGPGDECWTTTDLAALAKPTIYDSWGMPPIEEMPILALNYWPYIWEEAEDGGEWVLMDGWGGQCDADCRYFANGVQTDLDWMDQSAACITGWTGRAPHNTTVVNLPGFSDYVCNDSFGEPNYREPFFHEDRGLWVIPLDRFSPTPSAQLVWNWSLSSRPVTPTAPRPAQD